MSPQDDTAVLQVAHSRGGGAVIDAVGPPPPADRRSAFANAPMGVGLTTPEGVLVDANPALCLMVGRTPEELHGRSVLALVHAEGTTAAQEAYDSLVAAPTRPMRHETRLMRSDGSEVPVQVTASWVRATAEQPAH